jgi:alpha-galactosidase
LVTLKRAYAFENHPLPLFKDDKCLKIQGKVLMENSLIKINLVGSKNCLWRYTLKATGRSFEISPPCFEVEGKQTPTAFTFLGSVEPPLNLTQNLTEYRFEATAESSTLRLMLVFRLSANSPVVRFRYELSSNEAVKLTKESGSDHATYAGLSVKDFTECTEVKLGEFDKAVHSFVLTEQPLKLSAFQHELSAIGPIFTASDSHHSLLLAYEHGSQVPDAFINFKFSKERTVTLQAVKGTYYAGREISTGQPFSTVWFQFAATKGDQDMLARQYRAFVLEDMTMFSESRKPYVFYNTWNYQERNQAWNGAAYLDSMHQDRILAEIDVAHRMGVDVFVIDTGWYSKTGDWQVNQKRFPDNLEEVKARLKGYGMKLGLWFSPTKAASSSQLLNDYKECRLSLEGKVPEPRPVWETEESYDMCLVSRYWEAFADELIRLNRELGVTYFKWDAVHQYGCDDPHHFHGNLDNSSQERADCYAFELGRYLTQIAERVCEACPEAIVDFDITEGQRSIGLGFLAAGKYFLINNGPYFWSFDYPKPASGGMGPNVFVYPGPTRARVCRTPLSYDKWIPSVLFLTHYLPDDPETSQTINLASLVLGQNGVWGDLVTVSNQGIDLFNEVLTMYKKIRDDITRASNITTGFIGGSPEIHEKICGETGRGVVSAFAAAPGRYTFITEGITAETYWASAGVEVLRDADGHARLELEFEQPGAKLILFGASKES